MRPTKARPRCWSYRRNTRRRSPAIDASNSAPLAINSRGQETRTDRSVAGLTYTLQRTFDAAGNLRTLTYPDGEVVTYQYGTSGGFTGMTSTLTYQGAQPVPLVSGAYATPWGAPGGFVLGAATPLTTRYSYESRGRISEIRTGTSQAPGGTQDLALTYDDASNVTAVTDKTTGEVDAYTYDYLDRLTSMTVNGVGGTNGAQYQYDVLGNIRQKQEGASSLTLTYWTLNHAIPPHEVLGVSGSQTLVFAYDANGNQCAVGASLPQGCSTAGASQYKFDAENRVTSRTDSTGGNDTYVYGGQGTLLKRTMNDGTGNSAWTVYIGGA